MMMPGRQYSATDYKFGYNGQEKDNEIYGKGNLNTALFWEYDTRLGRRWNIDPIYQHDISNYAVFRNSPISIIDKNGDTPEEGVNEQTAETTLSRNPNKYSKKYRAFTEKQNRKGKSASLEDFNKKYQNKRWFKDHYKYRSMSSKQYEGSKLDNFGAHPGYSSGATSSGSTQTSSSTSALRQSRPKVVTPSDLGGDIYGWGFNVGTMNEDGTITVVNIGHYNSNLQLVWNGDTPNTTENAPIQCNSNGDILDNSGNVIYPLPPNAQVRDLFIPAVALPAWRSNSGGRNGNWTTVGGGDQVFRHNLNTNVFDNVTNTIGGQ